jgi:hypothetical protein
MINYTRTQPPVGPIMNFYDRNLLSCRRRLIARTADSSAFVPFYTILYHSLKLLIDSHGFHDSPILWLLLPFVILR